VRRYSSTPTERGFVADPTDAQRSADDRRTMECDDGGIAVTLAEVALPLAWNLRGNASDASFAAEARRSLGVPLPAEPLTSKRGGQGDTLLWLGPRSWLFVGASVSMRDDFDTARMAINAARGALFDLSASYVAWAISGVSAPRVLNRLCPLDLHDKSFLPGRCAQSLLGHVNALVHRPRESPTFIVMVARSLAADAWHALCTASASDGYRVEVSRPFDSVAR